MSFREGFAGKYGLVLKNSTENVLIGPRTIEWQMTHPSCLSCRKQLLERHNRDRWMFWFSI
jgi:hypothetical protein